MSREHADLLKRCYMSMDMNHEIMLGVQSRKTEAYDLLANIYSQVSMSQITERSSDLHHCNCTNS